jgi:hypothetical protein
MSLPTFQTIPAGPYVSIHGSEEITADIQWPNGHMASKSKMKNCHFDIVCCMLKRFIQEGS